MAAQILPGIYGKTPPPEGDPTALYRIVADFRDSQRQQALTAAQLRSMEFATEGQQIQNQAETSKLAEYNANAGNRATMLQTAMKQGQQNLERGQVDLQKASEELIRAKEDNGIIARTGRAIDNVLRGPKAFAQLGQIQAETKFANDRAAALAAEVERKRREADPTTPEGQMFARERFTKDLSTNPYLAYEAEQNPGAVQTAYGLDPRPIVAAFRAEQRRTADEKAALDRDASQTKRYEGFLAESLKSGNRTAAMAALQGIVYPAVVRQMTANGNDAAAQQQILDAAAWTEAKARGIEGFLMEPPSPPQAPAPSPSLQPTWTRSGTQQPTVQSAPPTAPRAPVAPARPQSPAQPSAASLPRVNTQAEYDALPSGATFFDPVEGVIGRKP